MTLLSLLIPGSSLHLGQSGMDAFDHRFDDTSNADCWHFGRS